MIKPLVLATVSAALLVSVLGAQQPPPPAGQEPTFRAGARTVPIYASVTDEIGRVVLGLTRADFEVRDDGKVQAITQFATDVQPLTAIVLLDGSRSMVNALDTVITAADHLVVRFMPGDRARIGSFADEVRISPAFTSNRDELAREVNDLFDLRMGTGTRLWDALGQASTSFEGAEGRRVVVFTDGDDTQSTSSFEDALFRARKADVMVYAVLIRGVKRLPEDRQPGRPRRPFSDLALDTGGGYYLVNNVLDDMNSIATEIVEELHSQYVLGFVPQALDGKLHKLEVRVRRPRLKIRARQSYLAEGDPGHGAGGGAFGST